MLNTGPANLSTALLDRGIERGIDLADNMARPVPAAVASGRKAHVCFVAPEAWPVFSGVSEVPVVGGAEVQQCALARLFVRAGHPVSMICFDYGQERRLVHDSVTVLAAHRLDAGLPVLRAWHPRTTAMWRAMREIDADIYYQRSAARLTAIVAAYCRWHGKRSIYAGASDSDFVPGQQRIASRRDRWLFERGLAMVDAIVVQNDKQERDCLANYGRQAMRIPSCYELPAGARPPGNDGLIIWAGNYGPTKRPELFLDIARRLPHRRFALIGGFADTAAGNTAHCAAISAAARALPNVVTTGFVPIAAVESWFDRAAVVVNTSAVEGMPNTFLQAWARGLPTVAFVDVGARDDGGDGGMLYPVVSSVAEAAAEIEHLLIDAAYRSRTGARCREYYLRHHDSAHVLASYSAVFDALVGTDGRR